MTEENRTESKSVQDLINESLLLSEQIEQCRQKMDDINTQIAMRALEMDERDRKQGKL